jgi:lysozyme
MYTISNSGLAMIAKHEGFVAKPYLDVVSVPTIGYGTTFYPNGTRVTMLDKPVTKEQALSYLKYFVERVAIPAITKGVVVPLTQNQVDALCSFIYNLGAGAFSKSTLLRKINAKRPVAEIQAEFLKWNKAGGKALAGLTKRRQEEAKLFGA